MKTPLLLIATVCAPMVLVVVIGVLVVVRSVSVMQRIGSRRGAAVVLARYITTTKCPDRALPKQSVQIGAAGWRERVTIGLGQRGLYVHLKPLYPPYPPIEIPWSDLRYESESLLFGAAAACLMVVPCGVPLVVPVGIWAEAQAFLRPRV